MMMMKGREERINNVSAVAWELFIGRKIKKDRESKISRKNCV